MPLLFAATLFTSASLLFVVQPMVGKMVLPLLGGSPAAWNTCMVFFQGLLLVGYLYAHRLTTRFESHPGRQVRVHLAVLLATVGWLGLAAALSPGHTPVAVFRALAPQGQAYPMLGILALLAAAIGLPFLVVSTSAPLLQRWFTYTGDRDPYFLYAASNAGSLLALLGYPLVIEPTLTLSTQAWAWAAGFALLTGLVFLCGRATTRPAAAPPPSPKRKVVAAAAPPPAVEAGMTVGPPTLARKLRWLGLAFVPSSLMLGVTFHMTTDIASVPLLWVIPLALYLLTFIIAYSNGVRSRSWYRPLLGNVSPVLTLLLVFVLTAHLEGNFTTFLNLLLHLVVYFFAALMLHSELARLRPTPEYLTGYFLVMSLGGVLGGVFNALVAPVLFPMAWEYPIAITVGCMLLPVLDEPKAAARSESRKGLAILLDALIPVGMVVLAGYLRLMADAEWFGAATEWTAGALRRGLRYCGLGGGVTQDTLATLAVFAAPCMVCFLFIERPVRFGLCVGALLLVHGFYAANQGGTVATARSFFGILKVDHYAEPLKGTRFGYRPTGGATDDFSGPGFRATFEDFEDEQTKERQRFGFVQSVADFYKLSHGTTLHGMQAARSLRLPVRDDVPALGCLSPWAAVADAGARGGWDFRAEPLTYYGRSGPVGGIFEQYWRNGPDAGDGVAMVGLGTGSVACYARAGDRLTFYEIDPTVVNLVKTPHVMNPAEVRKGAAPERGPFTFLADAGDRGARVEIVVGDARLKLEDHADRRYGLLLLDAFSSDSIPVHLLTAEAMKLYRDRVTDRGLIAVHISNRYIDLEPVVARLAIDLGLVARVWNDEVPKGGDPRYPGKTSSSWIVLAKNPEALGDAVLGAEADERAGAVGGTFAYSMFTHPWKRLHGGDQLPAWTDDYSDVLRVMKLDELRAVRRYLGLPIVTDRTGN